MRKRFLLEGEYQDKAVWIAIAFKEEAVSLLLELFWKDKLKKEMLQKWVRAEEELPKAIASFERTIADENLLTEDIKVVNVGKVRDIEIEWADNIMQTRMVQGFDGDLLLLKERVAVLEDYSQDVFDECVNFWERLMAYKKDNATFPNATIDAYKLDLDILFEALKALRKDYNKEAKEKAIEVKKDLELKLEILKDKFTEKPNYKFTVERLKDIRIDLNKSGLRQNHYKDIDTKINALFDKMGKAKDKVSHAKIDKRVTDLQGIIEKMQKSIDWDKRTMAKEERNKDNASMAFQVKLLDAKIEIIAGKLKEKQAKLKDVQATLNSLLKEK